MTGLPNRHRLQPAWLVEELVTCAPGRIQPEEFLRPSPDAPTVLLRREARPRFVERFEDRMSTLLTPEEGEERLTYWQLLSRQAGQLGRLFRGEQTLYRPFRAER